MEQDIRFCELDRRRIAYATVGKGPLLLFGGRWMSHLEEEWNEPPSAKLLRGARGVAPRRALGPARHRALRSRASRPSDPELETRQLEAVHEACGGEPATVFALCYAGHAAARFATASPERVRKCDLLRQLRVARRHPGRDPRLHRRLRARELAARRPDACGPVRPSRKRRRHRGAQPLPAALGRSGRRSRVPRARTDLGRPGAPADADDAGARLAPPGDRAVPISRGRELASLLPNARFVT